MIQPENQYQSAPNANVAQIALSCSWDVGDTVILACFTFAWAGPPTLVLSPALPALEFVGTSNTSNRIHLWIIRNSPVAWSGTATFDRGGTGVFRALCQSYSGVGRVVTEDFSLEPAVGIPSFAGPVTTTIADSWVLGLFGTGGGTAATVVTWNGMRVAAQGVQGAPAYYSLALFDKVVAAPGTNQAQGTATGAGIGTNIIGRTGLALEPAGGVAPDFDLTLSPNIVSVQQGGSSNSTVGIIPAGGFSGSVSLSVTGLPTGVTANFVPNPATGSSVLTLTATPGAPIVSTSISVIGTSGTIVNSITLSLEVVAPPSFALSVSPSSIAVDQTKYGTATVGVIPAGGFSGGVTLSATGLPAGVTALFTPNPASNSSTLRLTASGTATVGPATITIQGVSGLLSASAPISLTVNEYIPPEGGTIPEIIQLIIAARHDAQGAYRDPVLYRQKVAVIKDLAKQLKAAQVAQMRNRGS